jgi:DNA-binding transcriptional MocR family regulator
MNVVEQYQIAGRRSAEISASVEEAVLAGRLPHGTALPPVREMASLLRVSPGTVAAAYARLRDRGVVATDGRRGTRIAARPPLPAPEPPPLPDDVRDLATGNPDPALLPPLGPALTAITPPSGRYAEGADLPELLELAAAALAADGIDAANLAVVGGAMDGVERVLAASLAPGDRVAVEDPGYPRVLDLLRVLGLTPAGVALDEAGPLPGALERALADGVRAFVVTPRAQNPTGAALTPGRGAELRDVLAARPDVLVVEDDHAGPIAGAPAVTLSTGRPAWAVVRSMAKALGPDLRLAWLAGDQATVARVAGRQRLGTGWVSHVLQRLVVELNTRAAAGGLLERAAATYAERRGAVLGALAEAGVAATGGSGYNLWVPVANETAVVTGLWQRGWAVAPGERYRLKAAPGIRVSVAELGTGEAGAFARDLTAVLHAPRRTYSG